MKNKFLLVVLLLGIVIVASSFLVDALSKRYPVASFTHLNSDYDYFQTIQTFELSQAGNISCSGSIDPVFIKFPTGVGFNCSYWDKRLLDYYITCVTFEKYIPQMGGSGITEADNCGALLSTQYLFNFLNRTL